MTFWTVVNHLLSGYIPRKGYKPYVDSDGIVHAISGTEALDATVKGQTASGNRSFVARRVGYEKFEVQAEDWSSWTDGKDTSEMTPDEYMRFINGDME